MTDAELFQRIDSSPAIMAGQPVVRGTRLTVAFIVRQLAHGATIAELTTEYPGLTQDDVRACLLFAATTLTSIEPLVSGVA